MKRENRKDDKILLGAPLVMAKVDDPLENDDENDRGDEEERAEKEARELELKRRTMLAPSLSS